MHRHPRSRLGMVSAVGAATVVLTANLAAAQSPPASEAARKFTLWGVGQIDYRRALGEVPPSAPEHEFHLRRVRFIFTGTLTERIAYNLSVQGNGISDNRIVDMNVDFALTRWLKLRAGQNKYEFDIEGREPFHANPFLDRSFAANSVAGSLNGASNASSAASLFRDRGLGLLASRDAGGARWGLGVGAYQGAGLAVDNNGELSLAANANVETHGLRINGGYLVSPAADEDSPAPNDYSAWTLGASYDRGRVLLRAEYYDGRRDRGAVREDVRGFYLLGGVTLVDRLDLSGRYQALDDRRFARGDDRLSSLDIQAKLFFDRRDRRSGTFVAAALLLRDADPGFLSGATLLNDGRGAALRRGQDVEPVFHARLQLRF